VHESYFVNKVAEKLREKYKVRLEILINDSIMINPESVNDSLIQVFPEKIEKIQPAVLNRANPKTLAIFANLLIVQELSKISVTAFHFFLGVDCHGQRGSTIDKQRGGGEYFWRLIYEKIVHPDKFPLSLVDYLTTSSFSKIKSQIKNSKMPESFISTDYWDVISLVAYYPDIS
jgi:hypothetical protein